MASTMAAIRGLTAGNTRLILAQSGPGNIRSATRTAWRRDMNTVGRVTVRPFVGHGNAGSRVAVQQRTYTGISSSKTRPSGILEKLHRRLFHTSSPRRSTPNSKPTHDAGSQESLSLGQRMRKLSREYGWSALGVYLLLTALDFPFCYLLVRHLGADRIGEWEHVVVSSASSLFPETVKTKFHEWREYSKQVEGRVWGNEEANEPVKKAGWGVEEAEELNKTGASLATQLALAYAIHKSFIFIRVPLAAAITPKVVKVLRGWGWDIGKRTTKASQATKINPPKP